MPKRSSITTYMREIIFGLEDSLVSTLGVLVGVAAGSGDRHVVILSGLVLIAVEATSMAAGSYLSSKSADAIDEIKNKKNHRHVNSFVAGIFMWFFYVIGGFVPLVPFLILPINHALLPSIVCTGVVLFLVGIWSSKFTKRPLLRSGIEMVIMSFGAVLVGYLIGLIAQHYLGVRV